MRHASLTNLVLERLAGAAKPGETWDVLVLAVLEGPETLEAALRATDRSSEGSRGLAPEDRGEARAVAAMRPDNSSSC